MILDLALEDQEEDQITEEMILGMICLLNVEIGAPAGYKREYKFVCGSLLISVGGVRLAFSTNL